MFNPENKFSLKVKEEYQLFDNIILFFPIDKSIYSMFKYQHDYMHFKYQVMNLIQNYISLKENKIVFNPQDLSFSKPNINVVVEMNMNINDRDKLLTCLKEINIWVLHSYSQSLQVMINNNLVSI
jgi:predicted XRE-type DNA-binding protein